MKKLFALEVIGAPDDGKISAYTGLTTGWGRLVIERFPTSAIVDVNNTRQEIADYTKTVMDKIDDAKKRGAYNDLSVIAYELVNKLIAVNSAINGR